MHEADHAYPIWSIRWLNRLAIDVPFIACVLNYLDLSDLIFEYVSSYFRILTICLLLACSVSAALFCLLYKRCVWLINRIFSFKSTLVRIGNTLQIHFCLAHLIYRPSTWGHTSRERFSLTISSSHNREEVRARWLLHFVAFRCVIEQTCYMEHFAETPGDC